MDPLGVVEAVLALAVYPGGLFLAVAAELTRRAGGLRPGSRPLLPSDVAALVAAGSAASLAPLPGSPAASLPPAAGAAPNLVIAATLLAASVALASVGVLGRRRLLAGVIAVIPTAALAAGAATLALPTIDAAPGNAMLAARAAAAAALLLCTPVLCRTFGPTPVAVRATLTATTAIVAFSLITPAALTGVAAALAAFAVFGGAAAFGLVLRAGSGLVVLERGALLTAAAASAVAVAVVAVAGR